MKTLRVGMVDLDTSHPAAFVPLIRSLGHEVTAVFDSGEVNPVGYAATFAQEHGIQNVCNTLQEMMALIDVVFIHSCNWDVHVERARPFVEADKGVFIDKPFAGNVRDLQQLLDWSAEGAKISGGSSLRYSQEVAGWKSQAFPREDWVYAIAGCGVDAFNYGIHAYTMLHGLMGPGISQVTHLGTTGQDQFELLWKDGRRGMVSVGGTAGNIPFYANIVSQKRVDYLQVDNSKLYQVLLEAVLPYYAGEQPVPLPLKALAEAEMAAIAAKLSMEQGRTVSLKDIPQDYSGYDGTSFAQSYKRKKYPLIQS
ncbi:Gfo/Idh/MocA family protein [Paenibacillus koleovorans]|uniref:Gfo/Idh/MocA family protein n=1 Tax=Paenibacillus koleovorans TaxID=121608 RepID=UPI0013E2A523|nr:Gfo/Idh/MocA family oxidoreductase [Paenibacillus koleovorans]